VCFLEKSDELFVPRLLKKTRKMVGKGSSGLVVDTSTGSKERPVFIPPRKRQQTKSEAKKQNYVDHIVSVQVRYWIQRMLRMNQH